ncbi:unnamed protein product [[Actinomadura] parvosata subsp. kistnae]|uniref:Uncharacterized protein n=1 Tax=[Actinomadura] parvosata subsp. kistnae TaxID=1909395 RepID=A0A1U9ZSC3_9ACTN|nr:hypothetical protein [Nonomuraea sp. ATCC 55076]AQZ60844.1 hypothetical protein BKM31_04470 [Nonomuraea sp. ATCC 55076]SPL90498.1 unnamed protein product [Actinomadura parvosata subsp. kistnae]
MSDTPMTADDVLRIAAYKDRSAALEAMVIAYSYHRVAADLAVHLGRAANNWYCYATWTSKAVGESLDLGPNSPFIDDFGRRLRVPRRFRRLFRAALLTLLGPSYQLGLALANRAIFLETASLAVNLWNDEPDRYLKVSPESELTPTPPEFLTDLLSPADPRYLKDAAQLMVEAARTEDPAARAELMLGANIALSAYEQARAQAALELVLYRPVRWLTRVSWRSLRSLVTRRPFPRFKLYAAAHADQPWLTRKLESLWSALYTRHLFAVATPLSDVKVGKPLTAPAGVDLAKVWVPIQNEKVRKLAEEFITEDQEASTAGVTDWVSYPDRMRFIVSYFRVYQTVDALYRVPFDQEIADGLAEEMARGLVPEAVSGMPALRGRKFYTFPTETDPDAYEMAHFDFEPFLEAIPLERE